LSCPTSACGEFINIGYPAALSYVCEREEAIGREEGRVGDRESKYERRFSFVNFNLKYLKLNIKKIGMRKKMYGRLLLED